MGEPVLNVGEDAAINPVFRATDPVISPTYATPGDFAAQYPTPLDTTEIIAMCEEINLWRTLPEIRTSLKAYTWRELNSLALTSGSSYIFFSDGACPEEYTHDGSNTTITLKNLGVKKNLGVSDIMHSSAVAAAGWNGINQLVGGAPAGQGMPGGSDMATFQREAVRDLKEKEVRLGMTLTLNAWDKYLVQGNTNSSALQFDGFENYASGSACAMHLNSNTASGTFSAAGFDQFMSESCAKPTHVFGHPAAIQEMLSAYYQLGYQQSQVVQQPSNRMIPGYNFAGVVRTGIGDLVVVADNNFRKTAAGATTFQADLWPLRMTHNGEPLVYKITQIPLSLQDLNPGCTTISFEIWAKTALIMKYCCAQGKYTSQFTGRIVTTCTAIG